MCHGSQGATLFCGIMSSLATMIVVIHMWKFDKMRCLVFTRREAFRCTLLWMIVGACLSVLCYSILTAYVKYTEGWAYYPGLGVYPVQWELWPGYKQTIFKIAYWLLAIGWGLLLSVHLEEFLYWGYMMRSCRTDSPRPWFSSWWFRAWLATTVTGSLAVLAACGVAANLQDMETYIFLAGSTTSLLLAIGSVWITSRFPSFINDAVRLGATDSVIGRLEYVKVLNGYRTCFRIIYGAVLLTLSIDGLTDEKKINETHISVDLLMLVAYFAVFASTALSLLILLPRSHEKEATMNGTSSMTGFVRQGANPNRRTYQVGTGAGGGLGLGLAPVDEEKGWARLGDRLALERGDVDALVHGPDSATGWNNASEQDFNDADYGADEHNIAPFSRTHEDDIELAHIRRLPQNLAAFTTPLAVRDDDTPRDIKIVVTNTVVKEV